MSGFAFVDHADQRGGFKRPPHGLDQQTCPKCCAATMGGFGLMGGGFGPYVCCEECDWFYKEQVDGTLPKPPRNIGRQRTRARWQRQGRR